MAASGTERVLAVLNHKEPDRVPTFEWDIDSGVIAAMTGGGSYEDFIEAFDHDAVMCGPDYRKTPAGDGLMRDEWGVTRRKGHEDYAMPVDEMAPITGWADLEAWHPPDAEAAERFDTMARRVRRFKGRKAIIFRLRDVWSGPRDLLGYENILVKCLEEPGLIAAVVEKCIDHSIRLAQIAAERGAEIVMTGDDVADNRGPLVSPAVWESVFMLPFRRWVNALHDCGLYYWKHTDGNIMALMDGLVAAGIDGIDPVDPIAGMDLATFKERWGEKVAIKGNVDCARLLVSGTAEEVAEAVEHCIRVAGPGGGYVCSSSNSIHSGVRPELYRAMLDAIRRFGTYPLSP